MKKKHIVELTDTQREELKAYVNKGTNKANKIKRANILLKADSKGPGWTDRQIAEAFGCNTKTVYNVRRFVEKGLSGALDRVRRKAPPCPRKLDGEAEARLIALSCSEPPAGFGRWSLRLLASELVRLEIVESISPETVRQTLKKNALKPHLVNQWVISPEENAAFVRAMEEVLDLYKKPLDPDVPVVNMDEQSVTLREDIRVPCPIKQGQVKRVDNEYRRNGTATTFPIHRSTNGLKKCVCA